MIYVVAHASRPRRKQKMTKCLFKRLSAAARTLLIGNLSKAVNRSFRFRIIRVGSAQDVVHSLRTNGITSISLSGAKVATPRATPRLEAASATRIVGRTLDSFPARLGFARLCADGPLARPSEKNVVVNPL